MNKHARGAACALGLFLIAAAFAPAEEFVVTKPPAHLKLDPFYAKYVSADGYPVLSSAKVNDYALKEAAFLINMMLAQRPDVRKAMIESGSRLVVMAHDEYTTDVPEHSRLRPKDFWDRRARGLGGSKTDPVCSCGEENLLAFKGDPYHAESILIHEFAHNIHLRGMVRVDKTFDDRLKKTYQAAMAKGLWKGKYAANNKNEYFAEGVQSWFDNNRPPDHDHNHVDTRTELIAYDPGLAALCKEVFGDTQLKYTKPTTRLRGHMVGYDPAKSPTFKWPDRLKKANQQIKQQVNERIQKANAKKKPDPPQAMIDHEPRQVEGWTLMVDKSLLAGEHAEEGKLALRIIEQKLHRISLVLPTEHVAAMRKVKIYVDRNHKLGAMQYHPGAGWLKNNGYDPAMVKCVHIPRTRGLISHHKRQHQPWVLLHELAHAFHDQVLGFNNKDILAAFNAARESGKYKKVMHDSGRKTLHYAMTNHKEYFAEMTESYIGTNDFYPFVRAELKEYDPTTFEALQKVWGKRR